PTGANAFFLAHRTGTLAAASAGAVVLSTALSVMTLSAILALVRP
ncbi:MAG: AEC family transporter, partial [Gemmatimonadaceae bacterium]|nr:AEC family transporter [Acetobacteraceae bacterium]